MMKKKMKMKMKRKKKKQKWKNSYEGEGIPKEPILQPVRKMILLLMKNLLLLEVAKLNLLKNLKKLAWELVLVTNSNQTPIVKLKGKIQKFFEWLNDLYHLIL